MSEENQPLDPSTVAPTLLRNLSDDALLDLWRGVIRLPISFAGSEHEAVKTPEFYDYAAELLLEIEARGLLDGPDARHDRALSVARAIFLSDSDDDSDPMSH